MDEIRFVVFSSEYSGRGVYAEIDLDNLIDQYDYHDAPSSVTIHTNLEELEKFAERVNLAIQEIKTRDEWRRENLDKAMKDPDTWLLSHKDWRKSKMNGMYYRTGRFSSPHDVSAAVQIQLSEDENEFFKAKRG